MQKETKTIPFILVTGFLGSGKTTFLKRLLHNIPENLNLAVIQNEFAPSNVDGEELMQSTDGAFELLEINEFISRSKGINSFTGSLFISVLKKSQKLISSVKRAVDSLFLNSPSS